MTTQFIKLCYRNILETSTVTAAENVLFPKYRLYNRDIGKLFKGDAFASPFPILVNQTPVIYEVDRLIIPASHNLNGLACSLRYSTDNFGSDDHEAIGWTQGNALIIDKEFTAPAAATQYWKLNITAPATIVEMPEMFLTKSYTFQTNPNYGLGEGDDKNVEDVDSQSGRWRGVKWGEYKRYRRYELTKIQSAQKTDFQTWDRHCEGIKALYLEDHEGDLFFARLLNKRLLFAMTNEGRWATDGALEFLEVL